MIQLKHRPLLFLQNFSKLTFDSVPNEFSSEYSINEERKKKRKREQSKFSIYTCFIDLTMYSQRCFASSQTPRWEFNLKTNQSSLSYQSKDTLDDR